MMLPLVTAILIILSLFIYFLWEKPPNRQPGAIRSRYGPGWALITGASSGIGQEFARILAADGLDLILTARRRGRLERLAAELSLGYGVQAEVIVGDLASSSGAETLWNECKEREFVENIKLLVLNAGFGDHVLLKEMESAAIRDMVTVNCISNAVLLSAFLSNDSDERRGVIMVSSLASYYPLPYHALYAATKGFSSQLCVAVSRETNTDMYVIEPGTVETEFQKVANQKVHAGATADEIADIALNGLLARRTVKHVPGLKHWILATARSLLPSTLAAIITKPMMKKHYIGQS